MVNVVKLILLGFFDLPCEHSYILWERKLQNTIYRLALKLNFTIWGLGCWKSRLNDILSKGLKVRKFWNYSSAEYVKKKRLLNYRFAEIYIANKISNFVNLENVFLKEVLLENY